MKAGSEYRLHLDVVDMLRKGYPRLFFYTVDQTALNARHGHTLKSKGVRPGVADIQFVLDGGRAAYIELKVGENDQTVSQVDFEANVRARGAYYAVCRSLAEVQGTLKAWGVT